MFEDYIKYIRRKIHREEKFKTKCYYILFLSDWIHTLQYRKTITDCTWVKSKNHFLSCSELNTFFSYKEERFADSFINSIITNFNMFGTNINLDKYKKHTFDLVIKFVNNNSLSKVRSAIKSSFVWINSDFNETMDLKNESVHKTIWDDSNNIIENEFNI